MKVAGVASIYKFSCRLVRLYTARKSFERFRQPKSVEDEWKSVDNAAEYRNQQLRPGLNVAFYMCRIKH